MWYIFDMKILGIESSCDETSASLLEIKESRLQIKSNVVLSQAGEHKKYGGVVPEVAARGHAQAIVPAIARALGSDRPDVIAVTSAPGLITSLQVGLQAAKTLSYAWQIPLVGVNHLEGHLFSWLLNGSDLKLGREFFPAIGLIVSGGHTELLLVKGAGRYSLLGRTRDDAAGEAFDKVAKLLGLGYPGGPAVSRCAEKGRANAIDFPRPMIDSKDFDFSFSGLKTSVTNHFLQMAKTGDLSRESLSDICAGFQAAVIDVLGVKTLKAARQHQAKSVFLGGGVSANEALVNSLAGKLKPRPLYCPERKYTGDNAAMIALAGYLNKRKASRNCWRKLTAQAGLKLA